VGRDQIYYQRSPKGSFSANNDLMYSVDVRYNRNAVAVRNLLYQQALRAECMSRNTESLVASACVNRSRVCACG
jgi:hypothetical protein